MFSTRNYAVYDVSNIRQYVMVVLNEATVKYKTNMFQYISVIYCQMEGTHFS